MDFPYVYRLDRQGRKGQACKVLARRTKNSRLVEFEHGYRMVTSGRVGAPSALALAKAIAGVARSGGAEIDAPQTRNALA